MPVSYYKLSYLYLDNLMDNMANCWHFFKSLGYYFSKLFWKGLMEGESYE